MHRLKPIATALLLRRRHHRYFRCQASLDSLESHLRSSTTSESTTNSTLILYNYPSFSGAYAALFAHLYHSLLRLPSLILPFSSVVPLRLDDLRGGGLETCYLLDFIGPKDFAIQLSLIVPRVVAFDHRQSTVARISQLGRIPENLELRIDTNKSSARAVHDYFVEKLADAEDESEESLKLMKSEDAVRVENVLRYIEDGDLRRFGLPDIEPFRVGVREEMAKLNCVTNPHVFEQLLEINCSDLTEKGKSFVSSRRNSANELLVKVFKIRLGRGAYGECLAARADGNSNLSHEMCLELSRRSAAAGLRPIGAVIFMQRRNLKMCLRTTDKATDTLEIAKAYGGGGKPRSSSFIIRMDEYNHWTATS